MCCSCRSSEMNRREFMGIAAASIAGSHMTAVAPDRSPVEQDWHPEAAMLKTGQKLIVQPVLTVQLSSRRHATSWRPWGGLHNEEDVSKELARIAAELKDMSGRADFSLDFLPIVRVGTDEEAKKIRDQKGADVLLIYAASGGTNVLESCVSDEKTNIIFVRHRSGPVYLWYEIVHCRFLRKGGDGFVLDNYRNPGGTDINDVVVDDYDELMVKLRALYGIKNFIGRPIVALGGAGGWCCELSPQVSREKFRIDIRDVSYENLAQRIKSAKADPVRRTRAEKWTEKYLALPGTRLETERQFVVNAFLLYGIFRDLMREHESDAFTIQGCMSTVIPMAETTACLPLSLLNDEGYLAFCESDFNVIPSGILLHHIANKPVFLNDPTFPHHRMVTCAHCTAPRRMDGRTYSPARILTHFESDYGATPKVELPRGTDVTMICPDSTQKEWVGFTGKIVASPFYDICRSQYDIDIDGDWKKLLSDMRGFHWMMVCGDYSSEMEYACGKLGVAWQNVSIT